MSSELALLSSLTADVMPYLNGMPAPARSGTPKLETPFGKFVIDEDMVS